jgi:hypothetical protein
MHPMPNPTTEPTRNPSGADFSDRDIPVSKILVFGFYVTLFTVVSLVGLRLLYLALEREANRADEAVSAFVREARILPPEPRLQVDEASTWAAEFARQKASIEGYGWIDANAGVVRIPVSRAMELLAERGLPARTEGAAP